jgi:hypothetical protein
MRTKPSRTPVYGLLLVWLISASNKETSPLRVDIDQHNAHILCHHRKLFVRSTNLFICTSSSVIEVIAAGEARSFRRIPVSFHSLASRQQVQKERMYPICLVHAAWEWRVWRREPPTCTRANGSPPTLPLASLVLNKGLQIDFLVCFSAYTGRAPLASPRRGVGKGQGDAGTSAEWRDEAVRRGIHSPEMS